MNWVSSKKMKKFFVSKEKKFYRIGFSVNFINILRVFCTKVSRSFFIVMFWRKHSFVIFGAKISDEKHARKALMKLTPSVNFINVKRTNISYERHFGSFFLRTYVHTLRTYVAYIRCVHTLRTYVTYIRYVHTLRTYVTYIRYVHT